jgi:hypothetical protein
VTGEDPVGGRAADNSSDDEEIWRDLVARFDAPAGDAGAVPWPELEDLTPKPLPAPARTLPPAETLPSPETVKQEGEVSRRPREWPVRAEEEDHFVPPPPPPLPKVDPVTKGAWAALFGGPAYLLIATAAGWSVPGIAAFCAVAAFVGGFAVLVLRMDDGPPRDSGPDDGAVV